MYPQDEQLPTNRNTIGQAPAPFVVNPQQQSGPPKKEPKKANWLVLGIITGVVLLLLVIVGGIVLLSSSDNNNKQENTNQGTSQEKTEDEGSAAADDSCSSKLRRYQNEDLDIRFCYPNAWGDVKVEDAKFDPSDDGTRVRLSFADKDSVHLGLVSDDWSTDVARDGTCVDPGAQAFPDTSSFSARWVTEPATGMPLSALRGLEVTPDELLIQEHVDATLTNGACLEGFKAFGGEVYRNAMATQFAAFNATITSPQAHITDPTELIPAVDRAAFADFVKSVEKY